MRKFIHIDLDCFFAAVEMRDNPALKNVPIAIGGTRDRGVISTCNYIAREYGIRSAMPSRKARELCPNLVMLSGNMSKYKEVSKQFHSILRRYSDYIEPLSLDEAYMDVSDSVDFEGSATLIAQKICEDIYREIGITASAGVAPVKFVAKIASDENKPNGICVIKPSILDDFVRALHLKKIPGVGKVMHQKLSNLGLNTCEDILNYEPGVLIKQFGKMGAVLLQRARGVDHKGINCSRESKSIGVEHTFMRDLSSKSECDKQLGLLILELRNRVEKKSALNRIEKVGLKVKYNDFRQTTIQTSCTEIHTPAFFELLHDVLQRDSNKPIRLLGVNVQLIPKEKLNQLTLDFS